MKKKTFLGLDKNDWSWLAQFCYDKKWETRNSGSGVLWGSTVLVNGFINESRLDQAVTNAIAEAERVFGGLKYTKHPDREKKVCKCCGKWEYEL